MASATASLRIVAGSGAGRTLKLHNRVTVIGCAKSADLVIEGEKVAENHASIESGADGTYVLRNRSPFGTLVNKARVDVHPLADGERIQIGAAALVEFRAGTPTKTRTATTSGKKTMYLVLGAAYLLAMGALAFVLEGLRDPGGGGIAESEIVNALDRTRAMFDPERKDVARPSTAVIIDDTDPTAAYYRVLNAQLRGEDPGSVAEQLEEFMGQLGMHLRDASAFERQERWQEAEREYRQVMQMLPAQPSPVSMLAARRLSAIAEDLPDED